MSFSRGNDLALAIRLADAADSITLARYQSIDLIKIIIFKIYDYKYID